MNQEKWPPNPVTSTSAATEVEAKFIWKVLAMVQTDVLDDKLDQLLENHDLLRTLQVGAWIVRFVHNCRACKRLSGPLTTAKIENVKGWWIKWVQQRAVVMPNYAQDQKSLNLQVNKDDLLECCG